VKQKIELDGKRDGIQAAVAEATRAACLEAMIRAYEEGGPGPRYHLGAHP